uniref:Uncharacterized protein n=1 Tax=Steinernema glaseri TaxID=37863 RepID=A0A1I7ZXS5_9BILA
MDIPAEVLLLAREEVHTDYAVEGVVHEEGAAAILGHGERVDGVADTGHAKHLHDAAIQFQRSRRIWRRQLALGNIDSPTIDLGEDEGNESSECLLSDSSRGALLDSGGFVVITRTPWGVQGWQNK